MVSDGYGTLPPRCRGNGGTWQATLFLGALTLILLWFIIMGIFEIIGAFLLRYALHTARWRPRNGAAGSSGRSQVCRPRRASSGAALRSRTPT